VLAGLKTCKHRCCTVFISVALSSRKNVLGNFPIIAFCTWKRLVIFRACLFFKGTLYHHVRKYSFHAHFWLTWFLQSSKKLRSPDFPQKKKGTSGNTRWQSFQNERENSLFYSTFWFLQSHWKKKMFRNTCFLSIWMGWNVWFGLPTDQKLPNEGKV